MWAFLKKDFINEASYKWSFLFQFFSMFVNVGVFFFLSKMVGGASSKYISEYGGNYFSFVLIGVAFTSYLEVAINSLSTSIRNGQMMGTLEALIATQTELTTIIFSSSLYSFLFTSLRILIFLAIGILFFDMDLSRANYIGAFMILFLSILAFSCIGILSASFILYFKKGDPFSQFLSSVNWLLGGAYYPVEILPRWLNVFSYVLPITYSLKGLRLALLSGAGFRSLFSYFLTLVLFTVVLLPISLYAFTLAVKKAKEDGALIHY
jgi:ABC-2 type transport system permease protein